MKKLLSIAFIVVGLISATTVFAGYASEEQPKAAPKAIVSKQDSTRAESGQWPTNITVISAISTEFYAAVEGTRVDAPVNMFRNQHITNHMYQPRTPLVLHDIYGNVFYRASIIPPNYGACNLAIITVYGLNQNSVNVDTDLCY